MEKPMQHPSRTVAAKVVPFRAAISVNEFCQACSLGRTMFYRLVKEGQIRVLKVGSRTLIPWQELGDWLERLPSPGPLAPTA
jgi:excisionase family DNA binding protein